MYHIGLDCLDMFDQYVKVSVQSTEIACFHLVFISHQDILGVAVHELSKLHVLLTNQFDNHRNASDAWVIDQFELFVFANDFNCQ